MRSRKHLDELKPLLPTLASTSGTLPGVVVVDLEGAEEDSRVEMKKDKLREKALGIARDVETVKEEVVALEALLVESDRLPVNDRLLVNAKRENNSKGTRQRRPIAKAAAGEAVGVAEGEEEVVAGRMPKTPGRVATPAVEGVTELLTLTTNVIFLLSLVLHPVWRRASRENTWFSYVGSVANNCSVEKCLC